MAQGTIKQSKLALAYIMSGKTFTFRSAATDVRFTYKVQPADKELHKAGKEVRFWVRVLNNPDNTRISLYIGQILNGNFMVTSATRNKGMNEKTPSIAAFAAAFNTLKVTENIPAMLEVYHSGKCGKCGRKLTVPESVEAGFGPECINMVLGTAPCPIDLPVPVKAAGAAAQGGLHFPAESYIPPQGSETLSSVRARFVAQPKMNGREAAAAIYAPTGDLDARIEAAVADYRRDEPENFMHDGELTLEEALKVARNKFRVQLTQGVK